MLDSLNSPYEYAAMTIVCLTFIFIIAMAFILIHKIKVHRQELKSKVQKETLRSLIHLCIQDNNYERIGTLSKDQLLDLRNLLSDLSQNLKGNAFERLRNIYQAYEFDQNDLKRLTHIRDGKKLRALNRAMKLKTIIPFDINLKLLEDQNEVVRLLGMLKLIHHYQMKATPYLVSFIEQKKYVHRGYLFYLIQEIGKVDPGVLSFLFERIDDPEISEALLISAQISPPPRFDDIIYRRLTKQSAPFVIVWAIRVLMRYPSQKLYKLVNILKAHPFWAVRLEVLRTLHLFEIQSTKDIIQTLSKDENYLVRHEAINIAMKNIDQYKFVLQEIITDSAHPANSILISSLSHEGLKAA